MRQAFLGFLYFCICLLNPVVAFHNSDANAADGRYVLKEFTMDGCGACVAALKDVNELTAAGIDVRCFNTTRDPAAASECRKNFLSLRPAWRLTRADNGAEVGRWYGANKAGIIIATVRAKFPSPDVVEETLIIEESKSRDEGEASNESEASPNFPKKGDSLTLSVGADEETAPPPTPANDPADETPSLLEQIDAELGGDIDDECEGGVCAAKEPEDFRERARVAETFEDVGFLNDSLDEWERRNDDEETEPAPEEERDDELLAPKFRKEETPDEQNDARLGDRLTDRAAEHILEGVLCKIDEVKKDAFAKFDEIGGRATDQLERRVQKEFEGARALLEKRIDEALRDAKNEARKQIGDAINKTVAECFKWLFIILCAAAVGYAIWKASGAAKKAAGV